MLKTYEIPRREGEVYIFEVYKSCLFSMFVFVVFCETSHYPGPCSKIRFQDLATKLFLYLRLIVILFVYIT